MILETAALALRTLRGNLFRTVLTMLSVTIGAFSIVVMLSLAQSGQKTLSAAIEDADRTDESVLASREELTRRQASLTVRRDEARDQARTIATEAASLRERVVGLSRDAKRAEEGALRATITGEERLRVQREWYSGWGQ